MSCVAHPKAHLHRSLLCVQRCVPRGLVNCLCALRANRPYIYSASQEQSVLVADACVVVSLVFTLFSSPHLLTFRAAAESVNPDQRAAKRQKLDDTDADRLPWARMIR
eukprot:3556363-Amphidinium_carterae.1